MEPSTALAEVLVDELVRCGVTEWVLCPGSRNAPLSFALFGAEQAGRLRLHVRIDERSAGYLALGLSKGLARPTDPARPPGRRGYAAVVCTSGTAAANLHPAAAEAAHTGEPVVLVTADRPAEAIGTGANQTTRQHGLFSPMLSTVDIPAPEPRSGQVAVWRSTVSRALGAPTGPVHLNVAFREPLVPGDTDWPEPLDGRADGGPWTRRLAATAPPTAPSRPLPARTLVVVGHGADPIPPVRWPVIAEPGGPATAVPHAALLLAAGLPDRLRPDAVVVCGRPTLGRGVQQLLRETGAVHVIAGDGDHADYADPQHLATTVTSTWPAAGSVDRDWAAAWQQAGHRLQAAVRAQLAAELWPTGLHVARTVVADTPPGAVLFLGSSNVVRDVDLVAVPRADLAVVANRGLAGIDGNVSTAAGLALAAGRPAYALLGDLTLLHDIGGLLVGPTEHRPDLTVVVLNDDGGGIFALLEQGAPEHSAAFERIFGTPHGADLAALCAGYRVPHTLVGNHAELRAALSPVAGLRVVEVRTDRRRLRDQHARLRAAVTAALAD